MPTGGLRLGAEIMAHGGVERRVAQNTGDGEVSAGIGLDRELRNGMAEEVRVHLQACATHAPTDGVRHCRL